MFEAVVEDIFASEDVWTCDGLFEAGKIELFGATVASGVLDGKRVDPAFDLREFLPVVPDVLHACPVEFVI